ncbi:MAG: ATP-binding protein [Acidobacteriota bacterium]|nr:ATP-binding protein [Acidobacteriota bacterium]
MIDEITPPVLDPSHLVRFYEKPETMAQAAGNFLAEGLRSGDAAVVIATEALRDCLDRILAASGLNLAALRAQGCYVTLDAAQTLASFMVDSLPDRDRFSEVVGNAIAKASASSRSGGARAFGEMVAVLCGAGSPHAAIELERLWNELGRTRRFTLLCGYPMELFRGNAHCDAFAEICEAHGDIVPGESFSWEGSTGETRRAIALLQQRASSLEVEIGSRNAAEAATRTREQELADFLESAAEGIHKVGPDGRILWANRAELDLLGYEESEYVGHLITEFHVDEDVIGDILEKLRCGETLYDYPARLRCKDGSIKHVVIHSNVYRERGEFLYTRCFTRDVTDRVMLEEKLRRQVEQLAEADRNKDEFLAMLGHELRNPLSPVVTAVELARLRPGDRSLVSRSLEVIERQTRHMTRLIDDLLDVSRITRNAISLRQETVGLTSALERSLEQVRPLIEQRGHQLTLKLPAEPVTLHADPDRLEQIFTNLLSNAAKYTNIGGRIRVEVVPAETDVLISVNDDGIGLAKDQRERIFELFVRSPDSGVSSPGGLGVGLTLVKRLTEMHGGSVEAISDGPGRGSKFVIRLPLAAPLLKALGVPAAAPAGRSTAALARKVLVVDDNLDAADGLAELIRSMGHSVRTVYDGASAIREAERLHPEIVVLDIGMPGMDGHEVARRLRKDLGLKSAILVALSGYGQKSDRLLSREAGFDHHLVKPVDLTALEGLLKLPS